MNLLYGTFFVFLNFGYDIIIAVLAIKPYAPLPITSFCKARQLMSFTIVINLLFVEPLFLKEFEPVVPIQFTL